MNWVDRLERRFGRFAIPHLPMIMTTSQVVIFALSLFQPAVGTIATLRPGQLRQGEFWRLFGPLLEPVSLDPIFFIFSIMLFYLICDALERTWGTFRFNIYILVGWLLNVAVALGAMYFAPPDILMSAAYLQLSLFVAFAWLFPDFELNIFFVFPVKVKYLALISWVFLVLALARALATFRHGGWLEALTILASVGNFLIFFGPDLLRAARAGNRRFSELGHEAAQRRTIRHTCATCGANNVTHPNMEFRYCTQCVGTPAYCELHLRNHEHKQISAEKTS
jgi:hypothetical protein